MLDELRAIERRPRALVALDDIAPLEVLDAPFERLEEIDALWRAVEALNVDLKMALLLRDVVGLSYTEIADSLEITLATVKWRIYKAREEVQIALAREGITFGPRRRPRLAGRAGDRGLAASARRVAAVARRRCCAPAPAASVPRGIGCDARRRTRPLAAGALRVARRRGPPSATASTKRGDDQHALRARARRGAGRARPAAARLGGRLRELGAR